MKFSGYDELMIKIFFFIAGIYLIIKIIYPIYSYSYILSNNSESVVPFYERVISKTNSSISTALPKNNKSNIPHLYFSYITKLDNTNPISYINNVIQSLKIADTTKVSINENIPINIVPSDKTIEPSDKKTITKNENPTKKPDKNIIKPVSEDIKKVKLDTDKPEVLILHSHTTECYNPEKKKQGNFSSNLNITVAKVGDSLTNELEEVYGISTVHDTSIHDLPTRYDAYKRARPAVIAYLKKYPSIRLIIDLHRDGVVNHAAETAIIDNANYARVMLVAGTKFKSHKAYNKASANFENVINHLYPKFSRGIDYKNSTYNQDLFPNMLLIEVGSNESSLEEALRTSKLIAKVTASYLK